MSNERSGLLRRLRNRAGAWLQTRSFGGSAAYWEARYAEGGSSGSGSSDRLATFKAEALNAFVAEHEIDSVIEFGCGDGYQLSMAAYPRYTGLDVSGNAIRLCAKTFANDPSKSFLLYDSLAFHDPQGLLQAELSMSLDVLYHLVEQEVYEAYLQHLFASATRFVAIYASDFDAPHDRHEHRRAFTPWVAANAADWRLLKKIDNPYPYDPADPGNTSLSDLYIYTREN